MQDFIDIVLILSLATFLTLAPWGAFVLARKVFRKLTGRVAPEDAVQSVSVTFAISGNEYGSDQERRAIQRFARRLQNKLRVGSVGEYDGDEFGCGEASLYFYGPSAVDLWAAIEDDVKSRSPLQALSALLIYGKHDQDRRTIRISDAEQAASHNGA